ncbi:DUF2304 family protein [Candidatus Woesearchaeota archaeon]|nr:DUF2304 family protein [Candidatus Woesearchaeota archaeon]
MVLGIQILGLLFGLFMLYLTFLHRKRKEFTIKETLFWFLLWIAFIIVTLYPGSIDFFVKDLLMMSRTMDFFIVIGFMFLIGALFYTYTIVRGNQNRVEELVRRIALEKKEKK